MIVVGGLFEKISGAMITRIRTVKELTIIVFAIPTRKNIYSQNKQTTTMTLERSKGATYCRDTLVSWIDKGEYGVSDFQVDMNVDGEKKRLTRYSTKISL